MCMAGDEIMLERNIFELLRAFVRVYLPLPDSRFADFRNIDGNTCLNMKIQKFTHPQGHIHGPRTILRTITHGGYIDQVCDSIYEP